MEELCMDENMKLSGLSTLDSPENLSSNLTEDTICGRCKDFTVKAV